MIYPKAENWKELEILINDIKRPSKPPRVVLMHVPPPPFFSKLWHTYSHPRNNAEQREGEARRGTVEER